MENDSKIDDSEPTISLEEKNKHLQNRIKELEAAVYLLTEEKETLINNFQTSTNILIERIKKLEEQVHGQRPQTAQLMRNMQQDDSLKNSLIEG